MFGEWPYPLVIDKIVVMIRIGLILDRRRRLLSLRYPRLSATGGKHTAVELAIARHKDSFMADQRGTVAFEVPIIWFFLMISLLLPLADLAIAGFKFISAHQALRDMAQGTLYNPPADVTSSTGIANWTNSLPTKVDGYTVTAQVYCGNPGTLAPCASDPPGTASPKHYTFTTSFALSPMVLGSWLCSTCTVNYSQPFQ